MSNFIYIKADEGQMLINLDQVVLVDEATGDSCRLGLSDGTRLVLHGPELQISRAGSRRGQRTRVASRSVSAQLDCLANCAA